MRHSPPSPLRQAEGEAAAATSARLESLQAELAAALARAAAAEAAAADARDASTASEDLLEKLAEVGRDDSLPLQ